MYCDYYNFDEEPFNITSDPNFLFMSPSHEEVLTSIIYGIQGRRGIVAIIGEVGTGKTTLLNTALEWLSEKTRVAYVVNFDVDFNDLLRLAIVNLGLIGADNNLSKIEALDRLQAFAVSQLADGGNVGKLDACGAATIETNDSVTVVFVGDVVPDTFLLEVPRDLGDLPRRQA